MSKVIFSYLNDKVLSCPICGCTENFVHGQISVVNEESNCSFNRDVDLETFTCSCGYVLTFDSCGKRIKEVWDENHSGDYIIKK